MPKTSNEGPTYAGLVDVSPPETVTPEWAEPTAEDVPVEAVVSRETTAPEHGRRPTPSKAGKR